MFGLTRSRPYSSNGVVNAKQAPSRFFPNVRFGFALGPTSLLEHPRLYGHVAKLPSPPRDSGRHRE
eukprot:2821636-Amphidinium_carterae.1